MDNTTNNIGFEFRKVRKARGLTIKEVSEGIVSTATLSRWERGKHDLAVSTYYKLLDRLNVLADEVTPNADDLFNFVTEVGLLMLPNNVKALRDKSRTLLLEYSRNKTLSNLLRAAIACSCYLDLSSVDLTDDVFKSELTLQLYKLKENKNWYKSDLILFCNAQFLLNPKIIYNLAQTLINNVFEKDIVFDGPVAALLNSIYTLIKKKDLTDAKKLLNATAQIKYSPNNYSAEYRLEFYKILLRYIQRPILNEMADFFASIPNSRNGKQLKEDLKFSFSQVKELYEL